MVSIKQLLLNGLVIDTIQAKDQQGVVREFADRLAGAGRVRDADEIERVLMERETLGSTGIGDGVAIPHGKLRGLQEFILAFGRSQTGVEFHSHDGKPVHLFFVLLTPVDRPGDHLKILARISRMLKNPVLRDNLLRAPHAPDLERVLCEETSP